MIKPDVCVLVRGSHLDITWTRGKPPRLGGHSWTLHQLPESGVGQITGMGDTKQSEQVRKGEKNLKETHIVAERGG